MKFDRCRKIETVVKMALTTLSAVEVAQWRVRHAVEKILNNEEVTEENVKQIVEAFEIIKSLNEKQSVELAFIVDMVRKSPNKPHRPTSHQSDIS